MAHFGPTQVPRSAVVPVAVAAARRAKIIAIVTGAMCATCLLLGVADVLGRSSAGGRDDAAAVFWVGVFGFACAFAVRRARRITAAARRAAADAGSTWTLAGNLIVAADDHGQPVPEHSFKLARAQVALLAPRTSAPGI